MNATAYYDAIRPALFGGKLLQGVVDTTNAIFTACDRYKVCDARHKAYILATAYHESYNTRKNPHWHPIREGFTATNAGAVAAVTSLFNRGAISKNYALPEPNGKSYYGRGYVQITWPKNYVRLGARIGQPLYENPDLALDRKIAAEILVVGMAEGLYTGRKLSSYINEQITDFRNARRIINGMDKADLIAGYAEDFYDALTRL